MLSGSVGGLLGSLLLLGLLLLLLNSLGVLEGVGNGSLVGFVESVVGVLGCSLKVLSGVGVTYRGNKREMNGESESGYGRKGRIDARRGKRSDQLSDDR